jgi:hypothetical protein
MRGSRTVSLLSLHTCVELAPLEAWLKVLLLLIVGQHLQHVMFAA